MVADPAAAAQAIVTHSEQICEREDHLWRVLPEVVIPEPYLEDTRQSGSVTFDTEAVARSLLYMYAHDLSQNKLAGRLNNRPSLVKAFGMPHSPRQQTVSDWLDAFTDDTKRMLKAAANGIVEVAVENDVLPEAFITESLDDAEDAEEQVSDREYQRRETLKVVELARKYAASEFDTHRAENKTYTDEELFDMLARICAHKGSPHSEAQFGWLTDDSLTCDDSTFLRALKKFATPADEEVEFSFDAFCDEDGMPDIESLQRSVNASFDGATENVINMIREEGVFQSRRNVVAIDITYQRNWVWPWEDKDAGIPKSDFPRMVSGYKKDGEIRRGYKFATITLVGDNVPTFLGVEPVKEDSNWEEDDAPSYSKAELVKRLLDKASRFVDIDEVLFDRGFYANGVFAAVDDRNLIYTAPVPKYEDDYTNIKQIEQHPDADAAVNHGEVFGFEGEKHHEAERLYVPSRSDDADGKYAVFVTNRDHVKPSQIRKVTNRYRRRWDIENQFKSLGEFLPKTSSTDYRVRFCSFVLATLIYNLWRLTDYLIKAEVGMDIRDSPVVTVKTFVRALGEFLRRLG